MGARGRRLVVALACVLGCTPGTGTPVSDAGPDAYVPEGVNPPAPPHSRALPTEVAGGIGTSPSGLPVLLETPPGPDGYPVQLVYDEHQDDPIARWGQCLGRVVACYDANPGVPVAPCLALVARCDTNAGGDGCCPTQCFDDFDARMASGVSESDAVLDVFFGGECVEGFAAQRDAAGVGPP